MAFPFGALATWDVADLVALAAPRPALAGGRDADPASLVRQLLAAVAAMTAEPEVREVADRVWSCEQPDGPRRIRQVVVAGDARALVVDTGLPGSPAAGILPLLARPRRWTSSCC